ncbi:MAG: hypothetical protein AB9869_33130 [Verrucomicrobiia bacterium]
MKPIIKSGGEVRGYIKETGDRKELIAPGGKVLGYYEKKKDQTYRPGAGGLVGFGDQTKSLLDEDED